MIDENEAQKRCGRCGDTKSVSEFNKHAGKPDGLQTTCKTCRKVIDADYYQRSAKRKADIRANNSKRRLGAQRFVWDYLLTHPCVDCGEPDSIVLEFDHVRGIKWKSISEMVGLGTKLPRLAAEIAKCDVRCANCHRRKTAERNGAWWKQRIDDDAYMPAA